MQVLCGKKIAADILAKLKKLPQPAKYFAVILAGDNPASLSFIRQKEKAAQELGIDFRLHRFPADIANEALRAETRDIAERHACGGVIFQLPAPAHIDRRSILNTIPREKDTDVLGEHALNAIYAGYDSVMPPSIGVFQKIIEMRNLHLASLHVAIIGLGFLVGKPIATWLIGKTRELSLLQEGSNLATLKNADLAILGAGVGGLVKSEMLKNGTGVIDFGCSLVKGKNDTENRSDQQQKIVGDFDISNLQPPILDSSGWYTPTPGGTGPILVAKLFENFYTLNGIKLPQRMQEI